MPRPFVLLDRDGTVIAQKHHLSSIEDLELLPGAGQGIRRLNAARIGVVVVTNQSVIGRGLLTPEGLATIHDEMLRRLEREDARVDAIYVCPHIPEDACACRKPLPFLAQRAASELGFELTEAFVIGDQPGDIELGRACGATTFLVRTGYGNEWETRGLRADFVADDLAAAAERIIDMLQSKSEASARLVRHIETSIDTKRKILETGTGPILEAARMMTQCLEDGGKILLCGNGGSAADAQHLAAEFVSVLNQNFMRPGLAAIALTTDTSILTASGNDFGFAGIFARQVQALGKPGDVVIGITTSGNSENVLRAIDYAQSHGMHCIALTGESGGKVAGLAKVAIQIPSPVTQFIQEAHIMVGHILCDLVEQSLAYDENGVAPKAARHAR